MDIVAGAWQFLLAGVIVVVKPIYSVSVTMHFLAHSVVRASFAKRGILFVCGGRRTSDLLCALVVETINVELGHVVAAETH